MKNLKTLAAAAICLVAFPAITFSQIPLKEVVIFATRYKYLDEVGFKGQPEPVKTLQAKAATYDIKDSPFYQDDYENYFVSFYLPEGKILAAYDKNGKLLRTAEKYKNIKLPTAVTTAVAGRFPNWSISNDTYLVNFYDSGSKSKRRYKLLLENGDQRVKISTDENGKFY